jgi:molecular chaperone DnaK
VEKTVNENRERIAVGELSRIESAIADTRKAAATDDISAIRKAADELQRLSHAVAEQLYKGSQGSQGSQGSGSQGSRGSQGADVKDGEVVDAEYAETK